MVAALAGEMAAFSVYASFGFLSYTNSTLWQAIYMHGLN